jgi:hypothetical protein
VCAGAAKPPTAITTNPSINRSNHSHEACMYVVGKTVSKPPTTTNAHRYEADILPLSMKGIFVVDLSAGCV